MLMLVHVQQVYAKQAKKLEDQSINWSDNGKSFVIRDKDALCKTWVPAFFGQAKFSSFTRKLYRWVSKYEEIRWFFFLSNSSHCLVAAVQGFRKVNVSVNDKGEQIVVFSNENFQRDDVSRLGKMQSITAAKIRNQLAVKSGLRREPAPENTSNVGNAGSTTGQSSAVEQLLRDRCSVTETARVANPGLLQYQHDRDQDILRTRSLLASRLNNSMGLLPTIEDATLLAQQQTALNRYRQSSVSLPTLTALGNYSSGLGNTPGMSLAARSQLDNLRLLETLDRQRATGIGPISNDGAFEPLLLQRQLRAAQMPTVDLASISSLDAYARIRGELESNITRQNLLTVPLQQGLHNRSSENLDRRYLAALAALLNHQNNR